MRVRVSRCCASSLFYKPTHIFALTNDFKRTSDISFCVPQHSATHTPMLHATARYLPPWVRSSEGGSDVVAGDDGQFDCNENIAELARAWNEQQQAMFQVGDTPSLLQIRLC